MHTYENVIRTNSYVNLCSRRKCETSYANVPYFWWETISHRLPALFKQCRVFNYSPEWSAPRFQLRPPAIAAPRRVSCGVETESWVLRPRPGRPGTEPLVNYNPGSHNQAVPLIFSRLTCLHATAFHSAACWPRPSHGERGEMRGEGVARIAPSSRSPAPGPGL